MQLVYTFHVRNIKYVNNIMVTATLQTAVGHGGSGVWHYELRRNVQNAEEIQHCRTNRDFIPSQWHNHQPCLQTQYRKQESPATIVLGEEDRQRNESVFYAIFFKCMAG